MASAARSPQHHNFYCYSTLLMDIGGDALRLVVRKFCEANKLSFHEFLTIYKDDLFHGRKRVQKCCKCPHSPSLSFGGAFSDEQWELLYLPHTDLENAENNGHSSHFENECPQKWKVNPSISLEQIEINVLADIVLNVRPLVLHYLKLHMGHYGQTNFDSFLNHEKHQLFHHFREENCCLCPPAARSHNSKKKYFSEKQWNGLFRKTRKCSNCSSVCSNDYSPRPLSVTDIYLNILMKVITITVPLFQLIDDIVEKRHVVYAHPRNDTRMDIHTFDDEWEYLKEHILGIVQKLEGTDVLVEFKSRIEILKSADSTDEECARLLSHVERMEYQEDVMYQSVLKVHHQILKEVTRERRDNIDLTRERIYRHMKNLRIMTDAVERGVAILQHESTLIFTGITGQGKTWHCLEILSKFTNRQIVQIDSLNLDLREWERLIGTEENIIIWIDGLRTAAVQNQKAFFERLQVQLSKSEGKMKFVSSILTSELHELIHHDAQQWMLRNDFIINLDDELQNVNRKNNMLTQFLTRGLQDERSVDKDRLSISIVSDTDNENLNGEPFRISESTVRKIVKLSPSIGFPECCRRFCSDAKLFSMGHFFFTRPTESILELVSALAKSPEQDKRISFMVLCLLCLHPHQIDLNDLHSKIKFPLCLQESLNVEITSKTLFGSTILRNIVPIFAGKSNRTKIHFQHETIKVAVFTVLCELDRSTQEYFIRNCPLDLVLYSCCPFTDGDILDDIVPFVQEDIIHERLIQEITFKPYRHSLKQIVLYFGLRNFQMWKTFSEKLNIHKISRLIARLEISKNTCSKEFKLHQADKNREEISNKDTDMGDKIGKRLEIMTPDHVASFLAHNDREFRHSLVLALITVANLPYLLCFSLEYLSLCFLRKKTINLEVADKGFELLKSKRKSIISVFSDIAMAYFPDVDSTFRFRHSICVFFDATKTRHCDIPVSLSEKDDFELFSTFYILSHDIDCIDEKISREHLQLAIKEKNVGVCRHLRKLVTSRSDYREKLLNTVALQTEHSYSFSRIESLQIQEEDFITAVMFFKCNDIELCEIAHPSSSVYRSLIFRFMDEYSMYYMCIATGMFPLEFCQKCSVRKMFKPSLSSQNFNISIDSCLLIAQSIVEESRGVNYYNICSLHLYDLVNLNEYTEISFNFQSAFEKINRERMKTFKVLISNFCRTQKDFEDLFNEACDKNSFLIARLYLEEEYEIEKNVLSNGFLLACSNGHTLVVDTLLSWKEDLIPEDILIEALRVVIDRNHAQTCACFLMSCQVMSYLRKETVDESDDFYKYLVKATQVCGDKYVTKVRRFYQQRSIRVGEHLLRSEYIKFRKTRLVKVNPRKRDDSHIKWNIELK